MTLGRVAARVVGVAAVVLAGLVGLAGDLAAQAPTVTGLSVAAPVTTDKGFSEPTNRFWAGERMYVTVVFSDSVDVTGTPHVVLGIATCPGDDCNATYASGTGTDTLVFEYVVRGGGTPTTTGSASRRTR